MDIRPEQLRYNSEFKSLSPQEQTEVIEYFAEKQPESIKGIYLDSANKVMEGISRESGLGRVYVENKVMDSLKSVLPEDYNDLDKDSKIAAIDKAMPILEQRAAEIDPVNKNDTAFYAKRQLTQEMRSILGEDVGEIADKRNRFIGGLIQSVAAPFSEEGTTEFLARNLPTKPEYDETNASVLAQAAGDFVGQIGMIMGAAAAITASGGTAAAAFAGSTALGLAQNSSRKFQENYNLAKADMGLSDDEALQAGIAGMPGAVIDSFGDALLLRGIKLGTVGKAFKSMTATEKAAEIVAKGGAILKDPKALRTFGANFIKGGLAEGVSESLGDAATAWGGYATSGHEGFKPSAESLWQSFWVGGVLGGTFNSVANTAKDMKNVRSLKELGKLDQEKFVALGEDAQKKIAEMMDKENYTGALELVKQYKSLVGQPETATTPDTATATPEKPKDQAQGAVEQKVTEGTEAGQKSDEELSASFISQEDAVAGLAKNLKLAPENPTIAGLKQTILGAVPEALNAVRAALEISPETQGLPSGGQAVSLGELLTAIETFQQEKSNATKKGKKQQSNQQQYQNPPQGGQASQTGDSNSAQQGQAPQGEGQTLTREQQIEAARNMTPEQTAEALASLRAKLDAEQSLTPEQRAAKVKEGVATEGEASPSFVITPSEAVAAQEEINKILAQIEKDKQDLAAAKKKAEEKAKAKQAKKPAKKSAKKAEVAPQEDQAPQDQSSEDVEASRSWVTRRIDNMLMLARYKSFIMPSFKQLFPTVQGLANTLKSRVSNGDMAEIAEVDKELNRFEADGKIVSKKDAAEMISFLEARLNTTQAEAAQTGISNIQGAAQGDMLFQGDTRSDIVLKNPKYKSISELTKKQLESAAAIVKALQALGINDQVSDADKLLALEIKQAINSGSFSEELISKLNEAAPSRAIFQNQVYSLKAFGKTTKDTIMKHFDVMALNFLKTGNSLQAFWARVPDIVVVDSIKNQTTARGSFVTQGTGGRVVEDQGRTPTGELVTDVAISTDETPVNIPFSPVPNRIVLVRGKYNVSTLFHENDHNMLVTGGAQQVVEAQEGGVELWDEVLTEVGATRGQPWSVAAHEKWARAREAWINGGEVKSVFTRVFNALKTIFTNIYTSGALTKHRSPVLEKAFVKIYDINTAPTEDVKAKVAREIGYEASKLIPYIPAGKLQKAQSLIESAKLIQDLGDAKEHLRKSASTLNQSDPEYNEQEVEKMEAVLEESMTGKEVQKGEPIYDTVDNFLKAQKNEQPTLTVIDEKDDERKQLTFFQNLKKSIEAIMLSARNEVGMYPQDRLNELEAYFSEIIKLKPSDLAQIVYTADTDENLSQWMTSDMKSALRFLMNVSFVGYDEIRSILQKNPSATFVDFMADTIVPEDLQAAIRQAGSTDAFLGKVNEAISTGLQKQERGLNLNPFAIGKIEDALDGLDLKTRKDKKGRVVYTAESKKKIADRLDALYPQGWVLKDSFGAAKKGLFTKTGLESKTFASFEKSAIEKIEYVVEPYNPTIAELKEEYRVHIYVRNGKPEVVRYATGNKNSATPWLLTTDLIKAIESVAQTYANGMTNLTDGDLFGFDVALGKDNSLTVTEVNPVDRPTEERSGGRSGYLEFPLYNMAVIAHIQNRIPPHALLARAAARSEFIKQMPSATFVARIEAIYQNFKDYASFTREMIRNFGGFIINHVNAIFSSLVAGNGKLTSKSESMVAQVEQESQKQLLQDSGMETVATTEQDQEYLALAANPVANREALQRMVDEAAKASGYAVKAYHGSSVSNITRFEPSAIKSQEAGPGFYFTTDEKMAENYAEKSGGKVYSVFLRYSNPLITDVEYPSSPANNKKVFKDTLEGIARNAKLSSFERQAMLKSFEQTTDGGSPNLLSNPSYFQDHLRKFIDSPIFSTLNNQSQAGVRTIYNAIRGQFGREATLNTIWLITSRDGMVFDRSGVFTVLRSNQIKSADPVTYDANGNIIPLSQRFNPQSDNILYQDSSMESVATKEQVDRFNDLTESLYAGRNSATQEEIDAWKVENPEAWQELSQMREDVLIKAGYSTKASHRTNETFTEFLRGYENKKSRAIWAERTGSDNVYAGGIYFYPENEFGDSRSKNFYEGAKVLNVFLNTGRVYEAGQFGGELSTISEERINELKNLGFDSAVTPESAILDAGQIVVFDPEQIKSADPISAGQKVTPDQWADRRNQSILFQDSGMEAVATKEQVDRFNKLTDSLYQGRNSATQEEIDTWKKANPESWSELSQMREDILKDAGYDVGVFHGTASPKDFTKFRSPLTGIWTAFDEMAADPLEGERTKVYRLFADRGNFPIDLTDEDYKDWQMSRSPRQWIKRLRWDHQRMGYFSPDPENRISPTSVKVSDYALVVFDPSQLKSAEPITAGKKITPDKWADRRNPNILFQDSGTETVVTPEQDQQYLTLAADLVANREALRKMVDEAANASGLERVYHGTFAGYTPRSSERSVKLTLENLRFPAFFTNSKGDPAFKLRGGLDKRRGQSVEAYAKVSDGKAVGTKDQYRHYEPKSLSELKSADLIIRDANGNIIPLSQRFSTQPDSIFQDSGMEATAPMDIIQQAIAPKTTNRLYQFAGETAQRSQFLTDSLDAAKAMAAAGKTQEEIRAITGWFPSPYDGKMRWEIPDDKVTNRRREYADQLNDGDDARFIVGKFISEKQKKEISDAVSRMQGATRDELIAESRRITELHKKESENLRNFYAGEENPNRLNNRVPLSYIINHPELFEAYPDLAWVPVSFSPKDVDADSRGQYNSSTGVIGILPFNTSDEIQSTILHEVQHVIQEREGFAKGTSPQDVYAAEKARLEAELRSLTRTPDGKIKMLMSSSPELKKAKSIEKKIAKLNPYTLYERTAGEIEARDVQARANLTPEQRKAIAPYSSENIAPKEAIVLFQDSGAETIATQEQVDRFNELTKDLYPTRLTYIALFEADEWKKENPEKHQEIIEMRKGILKNAGFYQEDGELVPFYHGTPSDFFDVFNTNRSGYNFGAGAYFSRNEKFAEGYTGKKYSSNGERPSGSTLFKVYLKIQNPYITDTKSGFNYPAYKLEQTDRAKYDELAKRAARRYLNDESRANEIGTNEVMNEMVRDMGHDSIIYNFYGNDMEEVIVFEPEQIKAEDPISRGFKVTPDKWASQVNPSILYQAQESSGYSDSAIRGIIGMGHSMLQMAGRLNLKIDNNKIQKQINTLVNSQNNRSGKPVKAGTVQKAASALFKSYQEFYGNLEEDSQGLLVQLAYEKSFAIEDFGLDADSLARRNNVRRRKGQPIEEQQRIAIQDKVKTLYNTFRNARNSNFFKNRMKDQISPEFGKVADRILKLVNRGLDNVMGAFNSTNEDLLLRFADNIDAYNKKPYTGTPEFIEQFNQTVEEVEEAVMEHLTRQFYAYNSAYTDAEGISDEINALVAQLQRMPEEKAIDWYERTVKIINQIEAAMFSIAAEGDPNGQSENDKKAAQVRAKREKMAHTHQAALLEKFPTADDMIAYQREKDGGVLTPEFEKILRDNYTDLTEAQIEDLSDTDLRVFNSTALTMIVGGSNTQFLTLPKRQWREAKVASWHALVESMTNRVGQSPLVRSIYRSASRSNFLERQLNNFDRVFQANVENFHVWIDRLSQYAPVRDWFDRQFFADFQASVFVQAENARKAAEGWSQDTINQYNDEVDTTVDANPYLWVMSMLSQYNLGSDPNKEFSKAVTRARTSIQRTIDQNRSARLVSEANRNLVALNYMLEGINVEADNSYDLFMNNATIGNRIGAGNAEKAAKRLELLSNITNYFQQDIANQKFIRENIFGKPFQTVVNYLPLKALKVDGTLDEWDWASIEPNAEYQVAAQNVNARSNEERVDDLGQDRAYAMDFFNMVERKAVKNALDKHAILPVAILSDIFKTESKTIDGVEYRVPKDNAIKTIFGSQPEVVNQLSIIKEKITHQMVQIYGVTEPATGFVGGLKKALSIVQGSMLSGVGQIAQQSTAAVVDYAAREEGNIGYMIDAMIYWSKNYNKYRDWLFVNNKDLYERGNTQGIREFERHVNNAGSELNSLIDKGWQGMDQIRKFMTISLRYGDKIGAELIFLAEHMKAVKQSGQMPVNGDYDIDSYSNPSYTARAQAQLAKFVGPSSAAGRSYWMSDHKQHYFLLRSLTGSFQSSAHNMSSQMISAARNIVALQSDKSPEGKAERIAEYRRIGSIMAQQATFTGMRYIVGAMITYAFVGAIKDAWDDEDGAIEEAQLALEAAKNKFYPSKADKEMAVTMAERRLADAKSIRRAVVYMKQQASGDALFKSMVRDQLQNLHIAGSVGDGFVPKIFMMVPNSMAEQSHQEAQDLVISKLKKEKSEALAMGDRRKAARIGESILNAQAVEYIPYFYDKKDKSGFGGIVGGMLDPIFTSVKEGVEDITRADKDFLTARAFVPDTITYMAALGLGQADVNRIARQLQRIDDDLSKNRDEANERAGKEVDKLTNKSKTPFLR